MFLIDHTITNTITQAMYAQCDNDGNNYLFLDGIIDWHTSKDGSEKMNNHYESNHHAAICVSSGWGLFCQWKVGSTTWQKMSKLKESHPLQTTEFAFIHNFVDQCEYNSWVGWILKNWHHFISKVESRNTHHHKKTPLVSH